MARKKKEKLPQKRVIANKIIVFVVLSFLALVVITQSSYLRGKIASKQPPQKLEETEDAMSQYAVPNEVLSAMNETKNTGNSVLGLHAEGLTYRIPIIMYHYVEYVADQSDKGRIALDTPPDVLDNEIKTLKDAGYTFLTASDFADILDGIKPLPSKPVMLTFDDSYRDFYIDAFPILKKYNAKAVQYVITGSLNTSLHMDQSQVQEIAKSGLVEIGAHTVNHIGLAGTSEERAKQEVTESKLALEKLIGQPVTAFAYPYGSFDLQAIQVVKQAGFRTAVSTVPGVEQANVSRFFAYRIRPAYLTGQGFLNLVQKNSF